MFPQPELEDHALLDSGDGEKLERFGEVVLRRPDPQALWRPRLAAEAWERADLTFVRDPQSGGRRGRWEASGDAVPAARGPEPSWTVRVEGAVCRVRPTPFKHVGLFPEQAANWRWLRAVRGALAVREEPRFLNLFGYTGTASVVARRAGFAVTHVDASRTSLEWARENAAASGLPSDAWRVLLDDALGFARREVRRGARYDAIQLDPPHHGRGPRGETWQLEEGLAPLLEACFELLEERGALVLSTYAVGISPLVLSNLLTELPEARVAVDELAVRERPPQPLDSPPRWLPAGFCGRAVRGLDLDPQLVTALDVLHADNHVLAVAKPAGEPTVADASGDPCLLERARAWVREEYAKPGDVFLGVVHRLDRPVSGVVVFARTSKSAGRLTAAFRERAARKRYLAVTEGRPREPEGRLEQWLQKDRAANRVREVSPHGADARSAVTRWRVLAPTAGGAVVLLEPETGRPHQLRVALASLGAPIAGDLKYGARAPLPDRSIALHAERLVVPHPTRPEPVDVRARLPGLDVWIPARSSEVRSALELPPE